MPAHPGPSRARITCFATALLASLAALLLGGCAVPYQAPAGAATGLVVVKRGDTEGGIPHAVHSQLYGDADCKDDLGTLGSIGWFSPEPKASQVVAGTRVFLHAHSVGQPGSGTLSSCVNLVSFVPQANARYEFTTDKTMLGCRIKALSQLAPPDFQSHTVTGRCL